MSMTTEDKYSMLLDRLRKLRAEYGFETAEDGKAILQRAIKGWAAFCGFFDAYIKIEEKGK